MIGNGYSGCSTNQFSPEMQTGAHKCGNSAHRLRQRSRISQLLEAVKFEFEVLMQEVSLFKSQRNEFERVFTSQTAELNALRRSLQDRDRSYQKMKKSCEEGGMVHQCRGSENRSQIAVEGSEISPYASAEIVAQRAKSLGSNVPGAVFPVAIKDPGCCPEVINSYRTQGASGRGVHVDTQNSRYGDQQNPQKHTRLDSFGPSSMHVSSSIGNLSPSFPPSNELKRDSSELHARHSCADSYVMHGLRKMQRLDNSKRASVEKEHGRQDRRIHTPIGYDQLKRHDDPEKDCSGDLDKQQCSKLTSKDDYKQALNLRSLESDFITRTWSKGNVNFTVAYQPKCENVEGPMLKIELIHDLSPDSVVCCVKFSDDGEMLATGCNYAAHIYSVSTGVKISTLANEQVQKDTDLYIRSLCFSPDTRYIATGAEDHVIRVWDIQRRKIKWSFDTHEQDVYSLDWFKEENLLVSGSGDKTIRMWDIDQGTCVLTISNNDSKFIRNLKGNSGRSREANVTSVAVNPVYFKCVATGSLDGVVRLWDLKTSNLLERFEGHKNSVYSVSFSHDGKSLVSGSLDKTVKVWDLNQQTISRLEKSSLKNNSTFKPSIQEEEIEPVINQSPRKNFVGHTDFVLSVAFAGTNLTPSKRYGGQPEENGIKMDDYSDIEWIISGSKDCSVIFWGGLPQTSSRGDKSRQSNGDSSVYKLILQGHENSVISVALAPHSGIFATGSGDTHARIWKISTVHNQKQNYLPPPNNCIYLSPQAENSSHFIFQNNQHQSSNSLPRQQNQNPKISPQQPPRIFPVNVDTGNFHRRFGSAQVDKSVHDVNDVDLGWVGQKEIQYDSEHKRGSADNEKNA